MIRCEDEMRVGLGEIGVCASAYSMCPPLFVATPSLLCADLSLLYYPPVSSSWCSACRSLVISSASFLVLSCSSLVCLSSIRLWSSANFDPSCGMNCRSRLVLKYPGMGSPFSVSRVYELSCLARTLWGVDHFGSSLRSVLNV